MRRFGWLVVAIFVWVSAGADEPGGRITVDTKISARQYTWTITNHGMPPIRSVEIPVHNTYNYQAPAGWRAEGPREEGMFRAQAIADEAAVQGGKSLTLQCSVQRGGADSGKRSVRIGFGEGGYQPVEIADVTVPVAEPASSVWATPVALLVLMAMAMVIKKWRSPKSVIDASPGESD
ncbi:MAG TPA: hypothetical protein VMZ31_01600 [Phycisphaerae bacterium]|nr:hypothetical protein [Phycisphaerae bacterium]